MAEPVDRETAPKRGLNWTTADDPVRWLVQFQLIAQARLDPELAAIFQRRYAQYRRKRVGERGQEEGVIRNDITAELLADQLSAIGEGWMMMLPIGQRRVPSRRDGAGSTASDTCLPLRLV
ncbi:TetR-like C-terminal domain-containing protein [Cupriavidus oxalaticus]|uniref:TetR-like C-terminal domain-containing protein n=1 Tax=Cupriavidus oxalaticus TaxID=96344 RepID=UPI003181207C